MHCDTSLPTQNEPAVPARSASDGCLHPLEFDEPFPVKSRPRLLVSVRNGTEALAAVRGGADIIDVKEPSAGSLGMASMATIVDIHETLTRTAPQVPCSVALGELLELSGESIPSIPQTVQWLKMGLSRCGRRSDWQELWVSARNTIRPKGAWIAVAYVDAVAAAAPTIREVLEAAIKSHCAGLLLDTFSKSSGTLLDALTPMALQEIVRDAQSAGLMVALAGRLGRCDLPAVLAANPDVIAVRSAVCRGHDRTAIMEEVLVREFHTAMVSVPHAESIAAR